MSGSFGLPKWQDRDHAPVQAPDRLRNIRLTLWHACRSSHARRSSPKQLVWLEVVRRVSDVQRLGDRLERVQCGREMTL